MGINKIIWLLFFHFKMAYFQYPGVTSSWLLFWYYKCGGVIFYLYCVFVHWQLSIEIFLFLVCPSFLSRKFLWAFVAKACFIAVILSAFFSAKLWFPVNLKESLLGRIFLVLGSSFHCSICHATLLWPRGFAEIW